MFHINKLCQWKTPIFNSCMVHVPLAEKHMIAREQYPTSNNKLYLASLWSYLVIGPEDFPGLRASEGRKDSGQSFELLNYRPPPGVGPQEGPMECTKHWQEGRKIAKQGCCNSNNSGF